MATKQNNFYLRWQEMERAEKVAARQARTRWLAPVVLLVTVCLGVWAVLTVRTGLLRRQADAIADWCYDPAQSQVYVQSLTDQNLAAACTRRLDRVNGVRQSLDSEPDITSALLNRVRAASSDSITVVFNRYDAASRELVFDARSTQVIDIPAYIRALEGCGVFSRVTYTGYSAQNELYTINLSCLVAAPLNPEAAP